MHRDKGSDEDYSLLDLGMGSIAQLTDVKGPKTRHPIGFAPPLKKKRARSGGRAAGSWPSVPHFDKRPSGE